MSLLDNFTLKNDSECLSPAIYDNVIVTSLIAVSIVIGFLLDGLAIILFFIYWDRLSKHMINWLMFNTAITNLCTIICASVGLAIEEFQLISGSTFVRNIFIVLQNEPPMWNCLLTIMSISFTVCTYSVLAVSVERWWVLSGRQKQASAHELKWTALLISLIWIGSIGYCFTYTLRFSELYYTQIYHTLSAIVFVDIIPCVVICVFFVLTARWLLYTYGAADNFSTKYLKMRYKTARFLSFYVIILPVSILPFTSLRILFLMPPSNEFLECSQEGRFFANVMLVLNRCFVQCANPIGLFLLSCRYRDCACEFIKRIRACDFMNNFVSASDNAVRKSVDQTSVCSA